MKFSRHAGGMILLEILISVAILSGGLVLVYHPLLASFHALDYADHRMEANRLLTLKIREFENESMVTASPPAPAFEGTLLGERQVYAYTARTFKLVGDAKLVQVEWRLTWKSSGLEKLLTRFTYLLLPHEPVA